MRDTLLKADVKLLFKLPARNWRPRTRTCLTRLPGRCGRLTVDDVSFHQVRPITNS